MSERICARDGYGRLITPAEIQLITGYNHDAACMEHAFVRQRLGTDSEDLLVSQYCEFVGLDYHEVMEFLEATDLEVDTEIDLESDELPEEEIEEQLEPEFDSEFMPDSDDENEEHFEDELKVKIDTDLVDDFELDLEKELKKTYMNIRYFGTTKPEEKS